MASLTKKTETKNVFSLQKRSFAKSFEGLNSSLALSSREIFPCKLLDFNFSLTEAKVLRNYVSNLIFRKKSKPTLLIFLHHP